MAKKSSFQLDLKGGAEVLQNMAMPIVTKATNAIASRASQLSGFKFRPTTTIGVNVKGARALGKVEYKATNPHDRNIAMDALQKSIDAGRV